MALGRLLQGVVVRAPVLWPLLRRPLRSYFDTAAKGWDERTGAPGPEHLTAFAAALLRIRPAPERVLEIGTGTGVGALLMSREFPTARVRGVDLSEQMVREAKGKVGLDPEGRISFKVADAAALPYGEESFDLIAQVNTPPFFTEITRLLRPGGHVIVATSRGTAIPFYTPESVLERRFRKLGVETVEIGEAGPGTFYVGRKENAS